MYYALRLDLAEDALELAQAVLYGTSPLGLEVRDHSLKLPPDVAPLAVGRVQLVAYYDDRDAADEALREVRAELAGVESDFVQLADENWAEAWKQHIKSVRVGEVWVGPSWEKEKSAGAKVAIVIDPGMAFGTGDHPTTAMCLEELQAELEAREEASVLDVGTGSGVLAIAAKKLGAGRVAGNDIDPHAVRVARENAASNAAAGLELSDLPLERIDGQFDVVLGNLFANVLVQLAPRLADKTAPGGVLLATGILVPQADEVRLAFEREGMKVARQRVTGEWTLLVFRSAGEAPAAT